MPDLSDLLLFHSAQVRNFYLLFLGQILRKIIQFFFHIQKNIMNSCVVLKTV